MILFNFLQTNEIHNNFGEKFKLLTLILTFWRIKPKSNQRDRRKMWTNGPTPLNQFVRICRASIDFSVESEQNWKMDQFSIQCSCLGSLQWTYHWITFLLRRLEKHKLTVTFVTIIEFHMNIIEQKIWLTIFAAKSWFSEIGPFHIDDHIMKK